MSIRRIFTAAAVILSICGCDVQQNEVGTTASDETLSENSELSSQDILDETEAFSNECNITLDSTISINGSGAWIDDNCIIINESGVYTVTGEMSDGMIYVDTAETVKIVLENAELTNKNGAAIISTGGKLVLEAADGTENRLTDGKDYDFARSFEKEDVHRSAIHSDGELYFSGSGSLAVNARYKDAVYAQKAVYISDCTLDIEADKAGIGSGSVIEASDCTVKVASEGDCIKTESESEGGITVDSCNLTLSSEKDGIQSGYDLKINGSSINVNTSGDILADTELSSKGIKALKMEITDSDITASTTDHSIKCDGEAIITGGKLTLSSSAGKGITAEGALTINADIDVTQSEEAVESKSVLTINGGNINVVSTDDGLNTGGDDFAADHTMNINGGTIAVNAGGDGLDANGDINVTGGTVIVFGPENNANSSLDSGDFGYSIKVSGGNILAMGSMGMMSTPDGECISSTAFSAAQGTEITVKDNNGNEIVTVTAPKAVNGLIFCSENAESCKIYADGTEAQTQTGFSGGFGGFGGGFGGRGGKSDKRQNAGAIPELPDGTMPEMTGERPEMPEGGFGMPDGDFGGFGGMLPPDGDFRGTVPFEAAESV